MPALKRGFRHHACESIEELTAKCRAFDEQGETVYFATSSFKEQQIKRVKDGKEYYVQRVQENVQYVRSFWLDLDVGESVPGRPPKYASQAEAVTALGEFARECGLPKPLIVSSGYGIHAYWPLTEDILPGQWRTTAESLKLLTTGLKMLTDPSRTADSASVLRPPGTHNRKYRNVNGVMTPASAPVLAIGSATPISYHEFSGIVNRAMKAHEIIPKRETSATVNKKVNEGATVAREYPPASAHKIADKCNQIREIRDNIAKVSEPHFYSAVQLLDKTIEGEKLIHEWSKPFPGYTPEWVDTKIQQIKTYGPTTCATFEGRNPGGCENCPFKAHVTSPIQLGVDLKEAARPVVMMETEQGEVNVEIPNPPDPFKRGEGEQEGLYVEVDGVPIQFYPYDLYPSALEFDESDQFETARIHHHLPLEGWKEFALRSSLVHAPKEFNTAMADKSVKYSSDGKYKDMMRFYMGNYLQRLQKETRIKVQYTSCGWKEDDTQFLIGNRMFNADGTSHHAGMSHKVKAAVKGLGVQGDFEEWKKLTTWLGMPGHEAHAFTLMIAFGAPLLHLMRMEGTLFNMVAETGTGKSTMARWMMSVYGDYEQSHSSNNSTINARTQKIGVFGNLPMYIDELSNITAEELSNLAYSISGGAGRERLKSDASIAEVAHWKTFVLSSSNHNLHNRLTMMKSSPKAETMRIFEYEFPVVDGWYSFAENVLHPTLDKHYGHAGEKYISFLVQQDKEKMEERLKAMKAYVAKVCDGEGHERFWMFSTACVLVGGIIAQSLGLINFDPMRVLPWIKARVNTMRGGMESNFSDEITLLSSFLDELQGERLIVRTTQVGHMKAVDAVKEVAPHAALSQRLDMDDGTLYIKAGAIKAWLMKRGEDYNTVVKKLMERKILLSENEKYILGKGTKWASFREPCWKVNLRAKDAGGLKLDGEL